MDSACHLRGYLNRHRRPSSARSGILAGNRRGVHVEALGHEVAVVQGAKALLLPHARGQEAVHYSASAFAFDRGNDLLVASIRLRNLGGGRIKQIVDRRLDVQGESVGACDDVQEVARAGNAVLNDRGVVVVAHEHVDVLAGRSGELGGI